MSFISERVSGLPPYLFSVLHQKKKQLEARGIDVIDLGIDALTCPHRHSSLIGWPKK